MKTIFFTFLLSIFTLVSFAQQDTTSTFRIIKTDGTELIGKVISQDAREVLFLTKDGRQIYVPQHTIKEIVKVEANDFNPSGDFIGEDRFATRYFITTNGLPVKKGEHYVQFNWFGPDLQFGLDNNLGIGVMTSWIGIPIIGTIKKSWEINENTQFALGSLVGTGSWGALGIGGALPFGSISFGDRRKNLAITGGYGVFWANGDVSNGQFLLSIAGMTKVTPKLSLVFDSFIIPSTDGDSGSAILIPGVRWHQGQGKAFQFGFAGMTVEGDFFPLPIPMVSWFQTL